ncbi:ATP synthase F1 subcomplex delta subunit [Homoserinimonas aerilata]|uniref:ATP synthase subunit delta n=1 Tax=Homoserinimonas aerilata TaxID=1162970 RepID=A0A542YKB0_9MICO|nr:F0F1 ATP synthase subunit delta [Homoserinimonas aerilata]TQL48512.1 ATP synthase F1 subcomplex delta subunit [Homoserinimonas aerilata]
MGSASREATVASRAALAGVGAKVDLTLAEQLFAAGRTIGGSLQLRTLLAEPAGDAAAKKAAIAAVFGSSLSATAVSLLETVTASRWSSVDDLLAGVEDLGLRAAAQSSNSSAVVIGELFAFGQTVTSNPELELAIGSKLGDPASKAALVDALVAGKVSGQSAAIIRHLVQQPRGRRIGRLVSDAAATVADQAGQVIATVTSAATLSAAQRTKLQKGLSARYGKPVTLNELIDPALVGGVRIAIGDDIIDGSIATKLAELRLQLAG